jgi:hypothetical protein
MKARVPVRLVPFCLGMLQHAGSSADRGSVYADPGESVRMRIPSAILAASVERCDRVQQPLLRRAEPAYPRLSGRCAPWPSCPIGGPRAFVSLFTPLRAQTSMREAAMHATSARIPIPSVSRQPY